LLVFSNFLGGATIAPLFVFQTGTNPVFTIGREALPGGVNGQKCYRQRSGNAFPSISLYFLEWCIFAPLGFVCSRHDRAYGMIAPFI
jgi:hypothetical protein